MTCTVGGLSKNQFFFKIIEKVTIQRSINKFQIRLSIFFLEPGIILPTIGLQKVGMAQTLNQPNQDVEMKLV